MHGFFGLILSSLLLWGRGGDTVLAGQTAWLSWGADTMCLLAGQTVLSDAEAVFGYMGPRCVRGCVGWCAVGLQMCVCVPVCGALHSCHAWGSTLLAQLPLCALAGEHGCSSGGGDLNEMQPTSAVRWMRLQPGSPPPGRGNWATKVPLSAKIL